MKLKVMAFVLLGMQMVSGVASAAGYGAIACTDDGSGRCIGVSDYAELYNAETAAVNLCQRSGESCSVYNWEFLSCVYGPNGSYACN